MKTYEGLVVHLHAFLTSVLNEGGRSSSLVGQSFRTKYSKVEWLFHFRLRLYNQNRSAVALLGRNSWVTSLGCRHFVQPNVGPWLTVKWKVTQKGTVARIRVQFWQFNGRSEENWKSSQCGPPPDYEAGDARQVFIATLDVDTLLGNKNP